MTITTPPLLHPKPADSAKPPTIIGGELVSGSGLCFPKSHRAWGYFPGNLVGSRIELTQP